MRGYKQVGLARGATLIIAALFASAGALSGCDEREARRSRAEATASEAPRAPQGAGGGAPAPGADAKTEPARKSDPHENHSRTDPPAPGADAKTEPARKSDPHENHSRADPTAPGADAKTEPERKSDPHENHSRADPPAPGADAKTEPARKSGPHENHSRADAAATAKSEPARKSEALGHPWRLDRRGFAPPRVPDALTFHGWSRDGRRFAFEVAAEGRGTRCNGRRWLRVVDAITDRFVAKEDVEHPSPEGEDCTPEQLEAKMAPRRAAALARHEVVPGHLLPPSPVTRARAHTYRFNWPNSQGQTGRLRFEERHTTDDIYSEAAERGAAYRLELLTEPGSPLVLEDGARRREGVIGYRLEPGFVFAAPEGPGFAVLLVRMDRAFEGARWSWMANGARRPRRGGRAE